MIYETIQNFPADIGMTDCVIKASNIVGQQIGPFNFRREVQVFPGARWEMEITFLPAERADADRLEAWLLSLRGSAGRFRMGDPWRSLPKGTNRGIPLVAAASAGSETFSAKGWMPDETGVLLAGDYLQIADRLHRVIRDVDSDGAGNSVVTVWPALRDSHAVNSPIITRNARGIFAKAENSDEFTRNRHDFTAMVMRAVEVV